MICILRTAFWIAVVALSIPAGAQERNFSIVLAELQYNRYCSSEMTINNPSPRFVDVEVAMHRSSGALTGLIDRKANRLRLSPAQSIRLQAEVENDVAWAEVIETVPSPRLRPVLTVNGNTECLDGNELLKARREVVPVSANLSFMLSTGSVPIRGDILLIINVSERPMSWFACYSAGHLVSNGEGEMKELCSDSLSQTLAPFQSWRLPAVVDGNPLVRFRATGRAVGTQFLTPILQKVGLFEVESKIRFE